MSADDSEESRWPDFATASIRTHSMRSSVAQRSSSATSASAVRSPWRAGGFGSGTGRRCVTCARLAAERLTRMPRYASARTPTGRADRPENAGIQAALSDLDPALAAPRDRHGRLRRRRARPDDASPSRRHRRRPPRPRPPAADARPARAGLAETGTSRTAPPRAATEDPRADRARALGGAPTVRRYVAALDARDGDAGLRTARPRRARRGRACRSRADPVRGARGLDRLSRPARAAGLGGARVTDVRVGRDRRARGASGRDDVVTALRRPRRGLGRGRRRLPHAGRRAAG